MEFLDELKKGIAIASSPVSTHLRLCDRQNESSLETASGYRHAQEGYGKPDEVHLKA
ncbi:MAG: hypothetical protein MR519_00165 [Spirochaetaceae bacterium]|nr:hypothetical protein [Spirochaetaceae bacterium]